MNTSNKRFLGFLCVLMTGLSVRGATFLKYAVLPVGLIGGSSWGLYTYREKIVQRFLQDMMDEKVVDLILLTVKPRSNATDAELKQQAQLIEFRDAVCNVLAQNEDKRVQSKANLMKNAAAVFDSLSAQVHMQQNPYHGSSEAQQWQTLFYVPTGIWRCLNICFWVSPELLKKIVLDSIVQSVQLEVMKASEMTSAQLAEQKDLLVRRKKIKESLRNRIDTMPEEAFKDQFVPTVSPGETDGMIRSLLKRGVQRIYSREITKQRVLAVVDQADLLIELFDSIRQ